MRSPCYQKERWQVVAKVETSRGLTQTEKMLGQDAAKSLGRGEAEEFDNAVDRTFARRGTTDIMHREQILQEALCAVRAVF
jgi:hypothetical protein